MKSFYALVLGLGFIYGVNSCGPSAKELEEKRIADAIRVADSIAMVAKAAQDELVMKKAQRKDSIENYFSFNKNILKVTVLSYDTIDKRIMVKSSNGFDSYIIKNGLFRTASSISDAVGNDIEIMTGFVDNSRPDVVGKTICADYVLRVAKKGKNETSRND